MALFAGYSLRQLLAGRGVTSAARAISGLPRGLQAFNALRRIYPKLSMVDLSRLYRAGADAVDAAKTARRLTADKRGFLKDIPINRDLQLERPAVNRVQYVVTVEYTRSDIVGVQYWTVTIEAPTPLSQNELQRIANRRMLKGIRTQGGSPPLRKGDTVAIVGFSIDRVQRSR